MCSKMLNNKQFHKQFWKTTVYACSVGDMSKKICFRLCCILFLKCPISIIELTLKNSKLKFCFRNMTTNLSAEGLL